MKICLNCERYVKSEDTNCPFCSGSAFEHDRPVGSAHWSRAKVFAARSAMATAALGTAVACGKVDEPDRANMASGGARGSGGDAAGEGLGMGRDSGGSGRPACERPGI